MERLRVLREVVRAGSISGAARALAYTPSAVSQQLAKLERETGATLLVRSSRGVRPTDAGEALARRADDILGRLADAEAEVRAVAGLPRPLRVGSFPTAGASILPPALRSLARASPDVEVRVEQLDPLEGLARVASGDLDLALLYEYDHVPLPVDPRAELTRLLEEPLRVVLRADHPATRATAVVLADLAGETWLSSSPRSSCHPFTERACLAAGFRPRIGIGFDDYTAMQALVAAGMGVAFAPDSALDRPHPGVAIRPVAFQGPTRRIYAAVPARTEPDPARDALLRGLVAASSADDAALAEAT
ncbi:MAG TPA: LysR family transcriptional regulator [Gaiellaceae bacterium]|nr:LysR family transcriptional regulator [Gaiellaceae bacterium]